MKQILFAAALLALGTTTGLAQTTPREKAAAQGLRIGDGIPMAAIQLKTTTGKTTSLELSRRENGLLVMFSCNTCPYVVKSQPRTQEVMKLAEQMHIGMIVLNANEAQRGDADSYDAMVSYAGQQQYTAPYAVDEQSKLANAFGATRTPEVYLFSKEGKLMYKGAMEDNPSDPANSKKMFLADAMRNMTGGSAIDPAVTKSIGCSIKRQ